MKRIWNRSLTLLVFALCSLMLVGDASAIGRRRAIRRGYWSYPPPLVVPMYPGGLLAPEYLAPPVVAEYRSYSSPPVVYRTVTEATTATMAPNSFAPSGMANADVSTAVPSRGVEILPDPRAGTISPLQTTESSASVVHP